MGLSNEVYEMEPDHGKTCDLVSGEFLGQLENYR